MGPLARNGLIYCWFIQKILQFGSSENFNDKLYTDWCYPSLIKRVTKYIPPNIYLLKGNKNTTKRCEICSKLNNKNIWHRSGVFIVKFEHTSHFLLFLLSTSSK